MSITIWHNPRCSKSRMTLQLLEDNGIQPTVVKYLETPPTAEELDQVLTALGLAPRDAMRRKEAPYKDNGLDDESLNRDQLIQTMIDNPVLIERPIVINGSKAAIGRPPEQVLDII